MSGEKISGNVIRIAYVLRAEERGGVEEHVLSIVKSIDRDRFKPYVVASIKLLELMGDELVSAGADILPLKIAGFSDLKGMHIFYHFLRQNHIDIVNTHMFITSLYYSPIAWLAQVPVLLETSHGVEKWRLSKGFLKRHSFIIDRIVSFLQSRILAVSHACRNDLIKIKKIPAKKITVVQNGRDLKSFTPLPPERRHDLRERWGLRDDELVFGVMARLDFQKGHAYLFEAVRLVLQRRHDFKVLIIGDGFLRDHLMCQMFDLNIENHVLFTGFQSDIQGYHGILDVNILPSLYEGLPLGLIEASAMGCPVIATRVDGTPEVIMDGHTGILVPPNDPQGLADAMMYAMEHREDMVQMGRNGRKFVLQNFSIERQICETEALYSELMPSCRF